MDFFDQKGEQVSGKIPRLSSKVSFVSVISEYSQ